MCRMIWLTMSMDELLARAGTEEEIVGPGGPSALTKRLVKRAIEVEITDHLGCMSATRSPRAARGRRAAGQ
jgi:hypothetical protein